MCQMSVMLEKDNQPDKLLMENVSLVEVKSAGVEISSLFDPPQLLPGVKVARIDVMNGKVVLSNC
jgi:predicted RNA-binding protein